MGCRKEMRPVYICQHVLPEPVLSNIPTPPKFRNYLCTKKTKFYDILDDKCPFAIKVFREVKNDDFETVINVKCEHLSLLGNRCSCPKAIHEADGKAPRQLHLFNRDDFP